MNMDSSERRCVTTTESNPRVCFLANGQNEQFTFDYVAGETTAQVDIFENVGRTIIDQCLLGYNGSVFAYG